MEAERRIVADLNVLRGKPVVRGTRLSVSFILDLLAEGWTVEQVIDNYPGLTVDDVRACVAYASERVREEEVYALEA